MAASAAATGLTFRRQRPEPARFWIRFRPLRWPGPDAPWLDLGLSALGSSRPGASLELPPASLDLLDDLVYLPPAAPDRRAERDALAAALVERGSSVLVQLAVGEPVQPDVTACVFDPLAELLASDLDSLAGVPEGSTVVWGLVAGITDEPELCRRGLEQLARAGAARVVPVAPVLEPREKRRLAGSDERRFTRLFHGEPASERRFAGRAAQAGLATRFDRPAPPVGTPRPGNRLLAARLSQIADLWLRLGRPESDAQELFRAARWIESADQDLAILAREGNLGVVDWLTDRARQQVEAALVAETPPLLAELESEYLGSEDPTGSGPDLGGPDPAR